MLQLWLAQLLLVEEDKVLLLKDLCPIVAWNIAQIVHTVGPSSAKIHLIRFFLNKFSIEFNLDCTNHHKIAENFGDVRDHRERITKKLVGNIKHNHFTIEIGSVISYAWWQHYEKRIMKLRLSTQLLQLQYKHTKNNLHYLVLLLSHVQLALHYLVRFHPLFWKEFN